MPQCPARLQLRSNNDVEIGNCNRIRIDIQIQNCPAPTPRATEQFDLQMIFGGRRAAGTCWTEDRMLTATSKNSLSASPRLLLISASTAAASTDDLRTDIRN